MFTIPSPLQKIELPLTIEKRVELYIKRDDLIHSKVSGNKWRKLKFNFEKFKQNKYESILTFGGAYSNHIAATAAAGKLNNVKTIGIIRGEELTKDSNSTLRDAYGNGMELVFVPRSKYAERYERIYHEELRSVHGNTLIINEGGANFHGVLGCIEIIQEIGIKANYLYLPSGTGTTTTGLLLGNENTNIVTVPVFKNGGFIKDEIISLLNQFQLQQEELDEKLSLLTLNLDCHFGGYGKFNSELIGFINSFYESTNIKLDQVYTAKMMYALMQDLEQDKFKVGDKIVALHTGGLQGLSSISNQLNFDI